MASCSIDFASGDAANGAAYGIELHTGREVFPFLRLPKEIRNIIYGYLLHHDNPVALELDPLSKDRRRERLTTTLKLQPQVCLTGPQVAFESFAILFGQDTFNFGWFSSTRCSSNGLVESGAIPRYMDERHRLHRVIEKRPSKAFIRSCSKFVPSKRNTLPGITVGDVSHLSNRFFEAHRAAWGARDSATYVILTIHWNLCIGTIASFCREDLRPLLDDLQNFKLCGEFMLTEVGHGLDALNIETTSTLQADGSFILHTPNRAAAKSMPPTSPWASVRRLAVVMARLIVGGEDRGVKSFTVHLTETDGMCPGITSRLLPFRAGAKPLDHAITSFDKVRLEPHALLGTLAKAKDPRADFLRQIWRVSVGTLVISMGSIPILKDAAYVVWQYSNRRCVSDNGSAGRKVPILSFSTQYRPIVDAVVYASVFEAYAKEAADIFRDEALDLRVRHGVASAFKAFVTQMTQSTLNDLIDRCGWQGLFGYNKIIENSLTFRGNSIAEGDVQVLCIRLAAEVLLGRYQLPVARDPTSLLARHESGVWDEARQIATGIKGTGRSAGFNAHILPRCRQLVEATGQRMAYEAAQASKDIPLEILKLFEANCIAADQSWYCEHVGSNRMNLFNQQVKAFEAILPQLQELLETCQAASWATSPIVKEKDWECFGLTRILLKWRRNHTSYPRYDQLIGCHRRPKDADVVLILTPLVPKAGVDPYDPFDQPYDNRSEITDTICKFIRQSNVIVLVLADSEAAGRTPLNVEYAHITLANSGNGKRVIIVVVDSSPESWWRLGGFLTVIQAAYYSRASLERTASAMCRALTISSPLAKELRQRIML
ncbi:hypothetical protein V491_02635 [Pseudogymnoascus sp. VKM F-3775]|nr:hypothetical protein V491_02635 [Pseudogymnoascus sp. VKM F-3775]